MAGSSRYESYQRREGIPSPKGYHEAKPGEKKDAAVDVDGVKKWNGSGFMAGRVHLWDGVQVGELETHGGWFAVCFGGERMAKMVFNVPA